MTSAISGPLRSPPKRSAMISRSRALKARQRALEVGRQTQIWRIGVWTTSAIVPAVELVERLLTAAAVRAEVVDEQVARDDDEPRADARLAGS